MIEVRTKAIKCSSIEAALVKFKVIVWYLRVGLCIICKMWLVFAVSTQTAYIYSAEVSVILTLRHQCGSVGTLRSCRNVLGPKCLYTILLLYTTSQKNCANLFLSELSQISFHRHFNFFFIFYSKLTVRIWRTLMPTEISPITDIQDGGRAIWIFRKVLYWPTVTYKCTEFDGALTTSIWPKTKIQDGGDT